jgi:hypothetical protein
MATAATMPSLEAGLGHGLGAGGLGSLRAACRLAVQGQDLAFGVTDHQRQLVIRVVGRCELIVPYSKFREFRSATPFTSLRADTLTSSGGVCLPCRRAVGWIASSLLALRPAGAPVRHGLYPPFCRFFCAGSPQTRACVTG